MNIRSSVRAVSRNAVLKVFPIIFGGASSLDVRRGGEMHVSHFGNCRLRADTPSPHRSSGIIRLGENFKIIYEAQSLTGKIFRNKELRVHLIVLSRFDHRVFGCGRQGTGSQKLVTGLRASGFRKIPRRTKSRPGATSDRNSTQRKTKNPHFSRQQCAKGTRPTQEPSW